MKLTVDLADPNEVAAAHMMLADILGVSAIPGSAEKAAGPSSFATLIRRSPAASARCRPSPTPTASIRR